MSCPECVHIELTQSSLLASGTLPVWDKGRERKLRTNKTDFFLLLFFPLSAQNTWTVETREILLFFTVSGVVGFIFLTTRTYWISQGTLSCCQMVGMVGQHLADQPSGQNWEASDFASIAYKMVSLLSLKCCRPGRRPWEVRRGGAAE